MTVEILLAIFKNLKSVFEAVAVIAISGAMAVGLVMLLAYGDADNEEEKGRIVAMKKYPITLLAIALVAGILTALPTARDLWEVRIDLIKFELASPEHMKAGKEEITRIAHKLECKYLGGCDDEEKKKVVQP